MTYLSLDLAQRRKLKSDAVRDRPYADRISTVLALRLLGTIDLHLDRFAVLDELDYLEGIAAASCTKSAAPFSRVPLVPFWHKHFATARHLIHNIGIRWGLANGGNQDFKSLLNRIARDYGDDPDIWRAQLAHTFVIGAIEDRQKRGMTGDWIIFAKHNGRNYYLDLASHAEGLDENAEQLRAKLEQGCAAEFPFLFGVAERT